MQERRDNKRANFCSHRFGKTAISLLLVACFMGGCASGAQAGSEARSEEQSQIEEDLAAAENAAEETEEVEGENMITDVYLNQSRYTPGENAVLTVEMESEEVRELELKVNVTHLTEIIFTASETVSLTAGEVQSVDIELELPDDDFTAYAVEVYLADGSEVVDREMSAAEVASDWSKFPRYAYLTRYGEQSEEEIRETLERLNKYHITGLFYYDVLDQHDKPLAGTVESPDSGWYTLANHYASQETVQSLIDIGHEYNMNSYLYNLIFGAYQGYEENGIDITWGLFSSQGGLDQDAHGELPSSWETQWIYLFNPANTDWQDYYLQVTFDVLEVYDYDGIQVDSLGARGTRYDYDGNEVNLAEAYVPLLQRIGSELDTRVIFNPVGGYGMTEMLENVDYDVVYEEVWPADGSSYSNLKFEIDSIRSSTSDDTGIIIAAYMNYNKSGGAFNTAGVLLTDAVLMASGAAHLEIGDTGMLKSEYYPGDTLRISDTLEEALRNYYSFDVAYENYLREASYEETDYRTYINGKVTAQMASEGRVWCFTKENEDADQVVNFINMIGVSSTDWVDDYGEQTAPEVQTNLEVKQYVTEIPSHVYWASPDYNEGIMEELEFEYGEDDDGLYVTFTMPRLEYWNMAVIKQ